MIKCFVDENQADWDLHLNKLTFAYNSSVHEGTRQTPFELMFGIKPRIPCDIAFDAPILNLEARPMNMSTNNNNVITLEDVTDGECFEQNLPVQASEYLYYLQSHLKTVFKHAQMNRDIKMEKAKWRHDRQIKKFEYEVGDLVLTDHPRLKKGLSSGLAHKFYGPYEIIAKNLNGVDYTIKRLGTKKTKFFQIHKSRLKIYFGHFLNGGPRQSGDETFNDTQTSIRSTQQGEIVRPDTNDAPVNETNGTTLNEESSQRPGDGESLYCYCRDIEYGEMVRCDNDDCEAKWFHFECAGLNKTPKGKWYCTQCKSLGFSARGRPKRTDMKVNLIIRRASTNDREERPSMFESIAKASGSDFRGGEEVADRFTIEVAKFQL